MEEQARNTKTGPRFQHHWKAIVARRRIEEPEAIGALHKESRRRNETEGNGPALSRRSGGKQAAKITVDFLVRSPLTNCDRQGAKTRRPRFDITNISARGAPSKSGRSARGCEITSSEIAPNIAKLSHRKGTAATGSFADK